MSHIFVWTFDGVMEAIFVGLLLLLGVVFLVLVGVEYVKRWWHKWRARGAGE